MEKDSNLRRRCQQIYSLSPLATRESTHMSVIEITDFEIVAYNIFYCKHFLQNLYFPTTPLELDKYLMQQSLQ